MTAQAQASSRISIALSGKNLSVTYLAASLTAYGIRSGEMSTLWCCSYLSIRPLRIRHQLAWKSGFDQAHLSSLFESVAP